MTLRYVEVGSGVGKAASREIRKNPGLHANAASQFGADMLKC